MKKKEEDFYNYSIEDNEEENILNRQTMWSLLPRIMTMPTSGWERVRRSGPSPDIATLRFLLPVSLLSGASQFFTLIYGSQTGFTNVLVEAVIIFCSFFLGYYIALLLAKLFLPGEAKEFPSTKYGRLLTMAGIASLALFRILRCALPMLDTIIEFLPLWTIFITYRGMLSAGIPQEKSAFSMGVMCVVIICGPMLVEWILSLFV